MIYRKTMEYLGYIVILQDGSTNPIAAEADKILCQKPERPDSIMLGIAIAEAWRQAEERIRMQEVEWHLEGHAGDPDAVRIVCSCGSRGQLMSRSWNYDEHAQGWDPQQRHIPPCGHVGRVPSES